MNALKSNLYEHIDSHRFLKLLTQSRVLEYVPTCGHKNVLWGVTFSGMSDMFVSAHWCIHLKSSHVWELWTYPDFEGTYSCRFHICHINYVAFVLGCCLFIRVWFSYLAAASSLRCDFALTAFLRSSFSRPIAVRIILWAEPCWTTALAANCDRKTYHSMSRFSHAGEAKLLNFGHATLLCVL